MRAFAFDIDGVLSRGGYVLPGARCALERLNRCRIPWIVLTNGGGKLESDRCEELSERIGVRVAEHQFLQSHTPFKDFIGDKNRILAIGGRQEPVRSIAKRYGFKDVVVPRDIIKALPQIQPFPSFTNHSADEMRTPNIDMSKPFDAIFVFHDTYDMSVDSQIIIDSSLSENGKLGTRKDPSAYKSQPSIPIYFSNADLQWATDFNSPRFGQGALIKTITGLYEAVTEGRQSTHTVIGKPTLSTYKYADKLLHQWAKHMKITSKLDEIYMVGDNQYSDIRGANSYGWESILVRTGVYKDGDDLFTKPTYIEDDVLAAVNRVME